MNRSTLRPVTLSTASQNTTPSNSVQANQHHRSATPVTDQL